MKKVLLALVITLISASCAKETATPPTSTPVIDLTEKAEPVPYIIQARDIKDASKIHETWSLMGAGDLTSYEAIYNSLDGSVYDDEQCKSIAHLLYGMMASAVVGCAGIIAMSDGSIMVNEDCMW